jgi:uncharacterized RDD family membrane protein YckC
MDEGILTGEGVLLDTKPATFASRLLGALIDLAVSFAVMIGVGILLGSLADALGERAGILAIVMIVTVTVVVPTTVETLTRGRSLGKLALGVRIVRDDGGPETFRQALIRALVGVVELWLTAGVVAMLTSMVHPQGKRLGDIVAGTYAARVRGTAKLRQPAPMPPELAWWAAGADMARLPDGLALAVRQFLSRTAQLHPASRVELGTSLTEQVQQYVRPLPPRGTHPERFLAAVLAERGRREMGVLARRMQREAVDAAVLGRLPHEVPDPA